MPKRVGAETGDRLCIIKYQNMQGGINISIDLSNVIDKILKKDFF